VYYGPTGYLAGDPALTFGEIDPFGRPEIRDLRLGLPPAANAVWRQGAWQVDGDSTNIEGDGLVVYGKAPNGLQDASNGAFARIKASRFGIRLITGGVDVGYGWRADLTEQFFRADTGALTFRVERATGDITSAAGIEVTSGEVRSLRGVRAGGPATVPGALGSGSLWSSGPGAPNGVIVGSVGHLYTDTTGGAGTTLWVKESGIGSGGWVAK
jgi:hypothetical protein